MIYIFLFCTIVQVAWAKPDTTSSKNLVEIVNSKKSTWKAGINFPHETPTEFAEKRLGLLRNHPDSNFHLEVKVHKVGRTTIPESFDARTQWPDCNDVISNIRDQGNCGSSWAFAATEVMSDRLCIETNAKTKFEFSPQDLISCCSYCGRGCNGGYRYYAWTYWQAQGIASGGDYYPNKGCKPYEALAYLNHTTPSCKPSCTNSKYNISYPDDRRRGVSYYLLKEGDVEQIQTEIMTNGPVQASYRVYEDFMTYKEGVYQHITGAELGDHAVKIIGWGSENGVPYWLVANSWGTNWANLKGYFKIKRGSNECGVEGNVVAGKVLDGSSGSADGIVSSGVGLLLGGIIFFVMFE